jgi:hypothetical protein
MACGRDELPLVRIFLFLVGYFPEVFPDEQKLVPTVNHILR